jgi:hypothetical protein
MSEDRETENHAYNTPARGTTDWHVPLNENFERLDSNVAVRDVESALDRYEPKHGAVFEATDTGRVYVADGVSWSPVETTGLRPTFASRRLRADSGATVRRELVDVFRNTDRESFDYEFDVGRYDRVDVGVTMDDDYGNDTVVQLRAGPKAYWDLLNGLNVTGHAEFRLDRTFDPHVSLRDAYVVNGTVTEAVNLPESESYRIQARPDGLASVEGLVVVEGTTVSPYTDGQNG